MDEVNAVGLTVILAIQDIFKNYESVFSFMNTISDPNIVAKYIFPFVSIFDSVFAADLLASVSLGKWFNTLMKWLIYEDRPYWWIKETSYYSENGVKSPKIYTNFQTCETGPGNPSGHVMSITILLTLATLWFAKIRGKNFCRKQEIPSIFAMFLTFFFTVLLTSMSRMYVGAHFPHQCLFGAILGIGMAHFVSNFYVSPFVALEDDFKDKPKKFYIKCLRYQMMTNICVSLLLVMVAVAFYWLMKAGDLDPVYSIKLAFKWCPSSTYLHYNSTPFYALVVSTGSMLGWSLCVTPSIKSYRYNTKDRSYLIAILSTIMFQEIFKQWSDSISKNDASYFYIINYIIFTLRPIFFLRIVPFFSTCRNKWGAVKEERRVKEKKKNN